MQRKFEDEIFATKLKLSASTQQEGGFIGTFVHDLLSEIAFIVFKRDDMGNVIYTEKGLPKVEWSKVLLNIGRILGKIVGIMLATKSNVIKH